MKNSKAFYWRQTTFLCRSSATEYGQGLDTRHEQKTEAVQQLTRSQRKELDLRIIHQSFQDVRQFVVGAERKGAPEVRIKRVWDVQPFFEFMPNR